MQAAALLAPELFAMKLAARGKETTGRRMRVSMRTETIDEYHMMK